MAGILLSPEEKAEEHDSMGLLYPRPRSTCTGCGSAIHLRWGKSIKPHWAHVPGSRGSCSVSPGESEMHKQAKRWLAQFLNSGGVLQTTYECSDCRTNSTKTVSGEGGITFQEEVKHGSCIFDIGGVDSKGTLTVGIEVWYKHKTTNVVPRMDIPWCELKAGDIIMGIIERGDKKTITIENHCSNMHACSVVKEEKISIPTIAEKAQLSTTEIAEYLGYCKKNERGEITWNEISENPLSKSINEYWKVLFERNKCIRCNKRHFVSIVQPYCSKCYKIKPRRTKDMDNIFGMILSLSSDLQSYY